MARMTRSAQYALEGIIDERAASKKAELEKRVEDARGKQSGAVDAKFDGFKKELKALIAEAASKFDALKGKYKVDVIGRYYDDGSATFEQVVDCFRRSDFRDYVKSSDKKLSDELGKAKDELKAFETKVANAKRELILRSTLNASYESVMDFINGLSF